MEDCKEIFCRLCGSIVNDENFIVIDEFTKQMLNTILLTQDLINHEHVACSNCYTKMYAAFDFKSTCLYIEDKIFSYINLKTPFVDLREIYLKEHEYEPVKIEDDQKICRLCLQLIREEFVLFYEMKLETVNKYIPEVNFDIIQDPVVCKRCFDSLNAHDAFIKTCLDVEMNIHNIDDNKISRLHDIENGNEIKLSDEQIIEGLVKIEKEPDTDKGLIKTEEIIIKSEGEGWESDMETNENETRCTSKDAEEIRNECIDKCDIGEVQIKKCEPSLNIFSYMSGYKDEINSDLKHETEYACTYETKCKRKLKQHQLMHNDSLELQMYKCDICSFESKFKWNLKAHHLIHKSPSETHMYKCDKCSYETKNKYRINDHQLTHKDPSEIEMYKCDTCAYETRYKNSLKKHQITHKDSSEVQMYKCDACAFETKYKGHLKNHQLLHKDPSEIHLYKCDTCSYETKLKTYLKNHQLTHKDPSETQKYQCSMCSYKAKSKIHLKSHKLVHEDSSKIQMYKCDTCDYETRYRYNLKGHQLKHKDSSEIQMYKCGICSYQTKYKRYIKIHQLKHERNNITKVGM